MWGLIDWKGISDINDNKILHDSQIQKYLRNIFQSHETKHHPTVSNIMNELHNYYLYIPILDDLPKISEVELALNNIHCGTGIDGLPPIVLKYYLKLCWTVCSCLFRMLLCHHTPRSGRNRYYMQSLRKIILTTTLVIEELQSLRLD